MKFYSLNKKRTGFTVSRPQIRQQEENFQDCIPVDLTTVTVPQLQWDSSFTPIKLSMTLQQPSPNSDPLDASLLWTCMVPTQLASRRQPFLVIRRGNIIFQNWETSSPPTVIYIGIDGISGYLDSNGVSTSRIARYELQQIISNTPSFAVTYVLYKDIGWTIPTAVKQIKMRVYFDDSTTPMQLPLPGPMGLHLQMQKYYTANWKDNLSGNQSEM